MYLGTNDLTLQTARAIRDEEIERARQSRAARSARTTTHRSRWQRVTRPARRTG